MTTEGWDLNSVHQCAEQVHKIRVPNHGIDEYVSCWFDWLSDFWSCMKEYYSRSVNLTQKKKTLR